MTITREQVADLQPGDVVELRLDEWDSGQAIRGPLTVSGKYPGVLEIQIPGGDGRYWVRTENGRPFDGEQRTLTVVSRAPRPLYVNHPRTEPVAGDVVRDADSDGSDVYLCTDIGDAQPWITGGPLEKWNWRQREQLPARLRLLVDGETGQVVP